MVKVNLQYDITSDPIEVTKLLQRDDPAVSGGVVTFFGKVRGRNKDKKVDHLYYEAHPQLAKKVMKQILEEAIHTFQLEHAVAVHRVGKVRPGELAVVVITFSAHRKEAYEANQQIIHRLKHEVPLWKKEVYTDGTESWGEKCDC